jgi:hypothetical protein
VQRIAAPRLSTTALAGVDAFAVACFVLVGYLSHHGALHAGGLARDLAPMLAGWFAAALPCRLYSRRSVRSLVLTWALGVPAGVALRAIVLDRPLDGGQLAFLLTSLLFVGVFVAAARFAALTARPA